MPARHWWYDDRAPVCVALKTKAGINFVLHGDKKAKLRAIFLQGVAASLDNNRFLLAALRRAGDVSDVCVVAVDAVGIGGSVAPLDAREYSVARSARDVRDVLEILNWSRAVSARSAYVGAYEATQPRPDLGPTRPRRSRAHVVGHSMGGMVAMEFAASHPDRVASLALLSTTAHRRALDYVPRAAAVPNGLRLLSARSPADRARVDVAFHFSRHFLSAPVSDAEREDLGGATGSDRKRRWREFYVAEGNDASERQDPRVLRHQVRAACRWRLGRRGLERLRGLRVLVAHGREDVVVRPSSARHLYRALAEDPPGCCAAAAAPRGDKHLLVLADAAHMVTSSHASRLAATLRAFWAGTY